MKFFVLFLGVITINEATQWEDFRRMSIEFRKNLELHRKTTTSTAKSLTTGTTTTTGTFTTTGTTTTTTPATAQETETTATETGESNIRTFDGEFGVIRKNRLKKISDHFRKHQSHQSDASKDTMKLLSHSFTPVDMSSSLAAHDPYTLNEAAGVSEYLFQGDIHLTEEQLDSIEKQFEQIDDTGRSKRQVSSIFNKWTNNKINYYFHTSASDRLKAVVKYSLNYLQNRTCLTFQENSSAANRIVVFPGSGCFATIGMVGGEQQLSLGGGCTLSGTVVHEFYHALGVWHMQMRSDRDKYVTIDLTAVDEPRRFNFDKLQANNEIDYTPYEYGSTMHYGANSFVTGNGISIVPVDGAYLYTMGGSFVSFYDIDMVNEHYGCNAKCPKSSMCKNGGKPNPANCNVCNCPQGYGGDFCDQRPNGCGSELAASTNWQALSVRIGDNNTSTFRDVPDVCNYWITAPTGYQIELKVSYLWNSQCQYGCPFQGVEFKTDSQLATNPRICCPEFYEKVQTSKLNPTPVMLYNHYYFTDYTINYRMVPNTAAQTTVPTTTTTTTTSRPSSTTTTTSSITTDNCLDTLSTTLCSPIKQYCHPNNMLKLLCTKTCGYC